MSETVKLCVGVDPDSGSKGHGVAIYENGKLEYLYNWTLMQFVDYLQPFVNGEKQTGNKSRPVFVIENVLANSFIYSRNVQASKAAHAKVSNNVGRCQQAQIELERVLEYFECPYLLIKPTKENWANDTKRFKRMTGWEGKSNPETRSASYFGFLGCSKSA